LTTIKISQQDFQRQQQQQQQQQQQHHHHHHHHHVELLICAILGVNYLIGGLIIVIIFSTSLKITSSRLGGV